MIPIHTLRLPGCTETVRQARSNTGTIVQYLFLVFFIFIAVQPSFAKPKAADLVTDGQPIDLEQEKYRHLFQELIEQHNFTPAEVQEIFAGLVIKKRVLELMETPWEAKPYYLYAPLFLTEKNISTGRNMLKQYREVLDRIEKNIGVDREIIIAIWGIETKYGVNQGSFNVFQTLNTLFDAYPRRSSFFRKATSLIRSSTSA